MSDLDAALAMCEALKESESRASFKLAIIKSEAARWKRDAEMWQSRFESLAESCKCVRSANG